MRDAAYFAIAFFCSAFIVLRFLTSSSCVLTLGRLAIAPPCTRLDFVGDICLDENWCTGKTAKNHMADYFSDEVKKELISADFTMANNEFAYTTRGQRQVGKAYCFGQIPKMPDSCAHWE